MNNLDRFLDWQPLMTEIFNKYSPKTVFEFGLGLGTEFFLDRAKKVYSLELLSNSEYEPWYGDMIEKYKGRENWKPYLFKCMDKMTGVVKLQATSHLARIKPDLVFVDPGVHFRGEIVNLCMKYKVPLIVAHDTSCGFDENDIYGWGKIEPEGYEKEESAGKQGTTLWKLIK